VTGVRQNLKRTLGKNYLFLQLSCFSANVGWSRTGKLP